MTRSKIFRVALLPVCILLVAGTVLFIERMGIQATVKTSDTEFLPQSVIDARVDKNTLRKECLVLTDPTDEYTGDYMKQTEFILNALSVGHDTVDVTKQPIPSFEKYDTVVLITPDYTELGNQLLPLFDWINRGGRMFSLAPFEPTPVTNTMLMHLGVEDTQGVYTQIGGLTINTDFMIGSKGFVYDWGEEDILAISLRLTLTEDNIIHVESNNRIPLLWEHEYGKGRIVVNNLGICGRETRGYYTAAYSLLQDAFAYPVINSSVFFIDDFPAPVPGGYNEYITKYYKRDVESFFVNIWWPDMVDFSKRYGLVYTGLLIEDYTDKTTPPFKSNTDTARFLSFGNTLLNMGGEIGYHGYSHQPICYNGFDFKGKVEYNTWNTLSDSLSAFQELENFGNKLFPKNRFTTYVPPSNILSPEGRAMLVKNFPNIKVMSGLYQVEDYEFEQEFNISDDGIINVPRIISGTHIVGNGYEHWSALNELSFQYVNTHFFHPDDVLDPDRGAELGWATMFGQFQEYVQWLYDAAPNLRSQTSTEAGKAVQRYDTIAVQRTVTDTGMTIHILNYYDSAYLIVRIQDGRPAEVSGGSLEEVGTGLYVLTANSDTVQIEIAR